MKKLAVITSILCMAILATVGFAELDSKAWSGLNREWNQAFRGRSGLSSIIQRGKFTSAIEDSIKSVATLSGQAYMNGQKDFVKQLEAKLDEEAQGKIKILEQCRNADDSRALKLLATTVKLAAGEMADFKKLEIDLRKDLQEHIDRNMTKNDQGVLSGTTENLQKKNALETKLAVIKPFVTHAILVKRNALQGFSGARSGKAVKWLLKDGLRDKDWEVRVGVVEALAEVTHADVVDALVAALDDRDPAVRVATYSSLIAKDAKSAKTPMLKGLTDDSWEVRAATLEAIELLKFRDVETIDALVEAFQTEEGRLQDDFDNVLYAITGKSFYGDPELWMRWWEVNKEKWAAKEKTAGESGGDVPPPPPPPQQGHKGPQATTSFYGIETKSQNIIYVLDCSGSMAEKANLDSMPGGAKGPVVTGGAGHKDGPDPGARPQGDTRLDVLKWQLKRTISMLPSKATFNVIFYNNEYEVFSEKMMQATPANKKKVFDYIDKQGPNGSTNIFDALEKAFEIANATGPKRGGHGDPRYGGAQAMGGADTFYLLSDGSPNAGRIPNPGDILNEVARINATRKVVIHTVAVGGGYNPSFMEKLAEGNGGKCVVVK